MRIIVAGSGGFIGTPLVQHLRDAGHDVVRLVRRTPAAPDEVGWSPAEGELAPSTVSGADAVVNLAGAGIGNHRWTPAYKREIQRSRVDATTTISHAVAKAAVKPSVLLNASAIGWYGNRGDEVLDESSPAGDGFLPDVCRAWESATSAAEDAGVRVCHLRTGLVLGPGGGMLDKLMPLFKAGLGGKLGSGRQYMSWISLADEVGAMAWLLDRGDVAGAVNLTGPEPVRNDEFTKAFAQAVSRPAVVPAPAFALRVALGEFSTDVLSSARVEPEVLVGAGYRHEHPDVTSALRWALTKPS